MGQVNEKNKGQKIVDKVVPVEKGETPKVVVGLDFGTTHSGFAFAHRSDPENVYVFIDWPGAPRVYCKSQTSLFYVPDQQKAKLEDWGWTAADKFVMASTQLRIEWAGAKDYVEPPMEAKAGVFATNFKLLLAEGGGKPPNGFSVERLIVDYLRCFSKFVINHLKERYGKLFNPQEVQWCLTVPAIWREEAKVTMENFMVKALRDNLAASIYPLRIILEPEAASFYCQRQVQEVAEGDKFVVVDLGGGTIDIVVHEKETALDKAHRVREVVANSGVLGGGTYVDSNFLSFLEGKIGCFDKTFQLQEPDVVQKILGWWLGPHGKCTFDGKNSKFLEVPLKLSKAWKKYDADHQQEFPDGDYYEEVEISSNAICAMFDTEINKAIKLVEEKLRTVEDIRYIFLVGGFSENPYVARTIWERFNNATTNVLSPPNPGAAICRGAVSLGVGTGVVVSRISKRWYGMLCHAPSCADDPRKLVYLDEKVSKCKNRFNVFVKKGQTVPENDFVSQIFLPSVSNQREILLKFLSSTNDAEPRYTTDRECKELLDYRFNVDEDLHLDRTRKIEVSMSFGKSCIEVFARRVNFGKNRDFEKLSHVELETAFTTVNK